MLIQEHYIDHNLKILHEWNTSEIFSWLCRSLSTGDSTPLKFFDEPSPLRQLQTLFNKSIIEVQLNIKKATVKAIEEWREAAQGINILSNLAILAQLIRASDAVPFLGKALIGNNLLTRNDLNGESINDIVLIASAIGGFAPNKKVEEIFEKLFFSTKLNPVFSAQLLNGLCLCDHTKFPFYLSRFLQIRNFCLVDFNDEKIVNHILNSIPRLDFCNLFKELDINSQNYIITNLSDFDSKKISFIFEEDGIRIVVPGTRISTPTYPENEQADILNRFIIIYKKKIREFRKLPNRMEWLISQVPQSLSQPVAG